MDKTVITLVAAQAGELDAAIEKRAATAVKSAGVSGIEITPLHPGKALDILLAESSPDLTRLLYQKLEGIGRFDVFIQTHDSHRKKRLLAADMDATVIDGELLDDLAEIAGIKDKIAPITAMGMRGEIDFAEALSIRVGMLKGTPVATLFRMLETIKLSPGAATLVSTMNSHGAKCALLSGGFDIFTSHVAKILGFYRYIGNSFVIENEQLTGQVIPPIVDKFTKQKTAEDEARKLGIEMKDVIAVGDGSNDIPMLQAAGIGVGYFAKPTVVAAIPCQIRYTDLVSILYMQGYRQEEISFL